MSKYIPKVGDIGFRWFNEYTNSWVISGEVIAVTRREIVYLSDSGHVRVLSVMKEFQPIPTKADAEREELVKILAVNTLRPYRETVDEIQKAGFTIPKKIKRSEIRTLVSLNSNMKDREDRALTNGICELLGDLVESDDD